MRKFISTITLSFTMAICLTALVWANGRTITVLHVNDTHSHLDAIGPKDAYLNATLGGIAKAATIIGTVKATTPNVLLLHAGDVFQGDPLFNTYFGVPEFQLMLQLGFDAMAVGNHEFGYGPDALYSVLSTAFQGGASFPLLSANLDMSGYPSLQTWIKPSIMKTISGINVGIFGLTIPGDPEEYPDPVVIRSDIVAIAQQTANELRGNGAQVVICLSHLGIYFDKIVANSVSGIDFIIGGHDHFVFTQPISITSPDGKPTLIFQAGEHYKFVGKLTFTVDDGTVTLNSYQILPVDASVPREPSIQAVIEELKVGVVAKFGDLYHTVIGNAPTEMVDTYDSKTPLSDTPLGNLVTDAFQSKTGTDIAITALGLISERIYKGPIVGADLFRSLSYGYDEETGYGLKLAAFKILGSELLKGMEIGLSQLEVSDDFFLQFSGMRFKYDPTQPVGQRVDVKSIHVNGKPFSLTAKYSATVNTGIVALLPLLGLNVEDLQILPDFEYIVVRDYVARLGTVAYQSQGRILQEKRQLFAPGGLNSTSASTQLSGVVVDSNHPNPFNPSTTISYTLPANGFVTLKVYNTLGQEVASLVSGEEGAGRHEVRWDASNLPSGVYFYQLRAGESQQMHKMVLMK